MLSSSNPKVHSGIMNGIQTTIFRHSKVFKLHGIMDHTEAGTEPTSRKIDPND